MNNLTFSFDIGYASIGWSVLENTLSKDEDPRVLGSGAVIFGADDCLASERRTYRRMRRTIRSRRKRIRRMADIFRHYDLLPDSVLSAPGHPAPFWLAARALQERTTLSVEETWHVLRWYAHNRGYDGNALWSNDDSAKSEKEKEAAKEDSKRAAAARQAMVQYGTATMAETLIAFMQLDTSKPEADFTVCTPKYRQCNWAFPRSVVTAEVERVLRHSDLPQEVVSLLTGEASEHAEALAACNVKLPRRYAGSVLFGQLVPRLDNRIIARCPITWVREYRQAQAAGMSEEQARHVADKMAKVPKADCADFYRYRFARILANLRAGGQPLPAELRQTLMQRALQARKLTKDSFAKLLREYINLDDSNFSNYFELTESADKALILAPKPKSRDIASGRAPYARPVLRQVTEEVLRGEDPTRPALSPQHPDGEPKAQDGVLYCLADLNSDVSAHLAARRIDEQTNNPLVRHRLLILERLIRDMVKRYAAGDTQRVSRCCIEVGRELRTFAGKTNKEIKMEEGLKLKSFHDAVKIYESARAHNPSLPPINAGLIRKCRIAVDMGWRCPFTGLEYTVADLPAMEREHIVPYADRRTNSMAALVLTYPSVNRLKGKRSALRFIKECGGQSVPGDPGRCILHEADYRDLVSQLKVSKNEYDRGRTATRKKLLLVENFGKDAAVPGFTEAQMTQSSQLMSLASRVVRRCIPNITVAMIPGRVTSELRRAWKLFGCLDAAYKLSHPHAEQNMPFEGLSKEEIRSLSHLHHAIDATTLGLAAILIPGGTNGRVWRALVNRRLSAEDEQAVRGTLGARLYNITNDRKLYLNNVPESTRESLIAALAQNRVVQHVPADMSGSKFETQYKRILEVRDDGSVVLKKREKKKEDSAKKTAETSDKKSTPRAEVDVLPPDKVIGLAPGSKLRPMKAALVIEQNYAIALDPAPALIRHHRVYHTLQELRRANGGKPIRLIRRGDLIRINFFGNKAEKCGIWRVVSPKRSTRDGLVLDLERPECALPVTKHSDVWRDVRLSTLLKYRFDILPRSYVGEF